MEEKQGPTRLRIDLVSDVVCPWCILGWRQLERGLEALEGEVEAEVHWHPFELNPQMPPEGQSLRAHIREKYGSSVEESEAMRARLTDLGRALGFEFRFEPEQRIYNTFDAHRLLSWADQSSKAHDLKMALFDSYFTRGEDVSDPQVLQQVVERVGLDPAGAAEVIRTDAFAHEVRAEEAAWQTRGISGVPAFIIEGKYLITGAQGEEAFAAALRQIAQESAAEAPELGSESTSS